MVGVHLYNHFKRKTALRGKELKWRWKEGTSHRQIYVEPESVLGGSGRKGVPRELLINLYGGGR